MPRISPIEPFAIQLICIIASISSCTSHSPMKYDPQWKTLYHYIFNIKTVFRFLTPKAMAGAFFESFVISEVIKSYYNKGIVEPPLYFYRDKDMREIDLLIEDGGILYPLEIKKHADPRKKDMDAFALVDKIPGVKRGSGGVICLYDHLVTLKGSD